MICKFVLLIPLIFILSVVGRHRHHFHLKPTSVNPEVWSKLASSDSNKRFVIENYRNKKIAAEAEELSGHSLINYVNTHQKLWTAEVNKFDSFTETVKYGLLGVQQVQPSITFKKNLSPTRHQNVYIPESFDSRTEWANCPSIGYIRDQSSCGSCWAVAAVEAMSDRTCIASDGKLQVILSADDLLSCCKRCGFGCNGGSPMEAWEYWVKNGIVTGSNYTQHAGCRPYPFPPCEHHNNKTHFEPCKSDLYPTPKCIRQCESNYTISYEDDLHYGRKAYAVENDVESIQKEILTNGPVEAGFEVYSDFLNYGSGIYKHVAGVLGGGHAVKILGWGMEQGVPYWLAANSWNTDWGENGLFRILRGVDECGIESGIVAGLPRIKKPFLFNNYNKNFDIALPS